MAYEKPQVTVDQNMTVTPTSLDRGQNAFVFGPHYTLHRYSDASEKASTSIGAFTGEELTAAYPGVVNPDNVDKDYTKLNGDNVVVQIASLGDAQLPEAGLDPSFLAVDGGYARLFFSDKAYVDTADDGSDATLDANLARNLMVGDLVRISYKDTSSATDNVLITEIRSVSYSASGFDLDDSSSSLETSKGTLITVADAVPETADADSVAVDLVEVLDGETFGRRNEVDQSEPWQWEQVDDATGVKGVKVKKLYVYDAVSKAYLPVLSADLFVSTRELNATFSDSIRSLVGASEVEKTLGEISPDNPLAMGVYMAALNATGDDGTAAVYYMATATDDSAGYADVLSKATLTDKVYVLCPTTRDSGIIDLVKSHVNEMSDKSAKKWRIAAVSAEVPDTESRLDASMNDAKPFYAIPVSASAGLKPTQDATFNMFRIVKSQSSNDGNGDISLSLAVGDDVYIYTGGKDKWGDAKRTAYKVAKVVNRYTVQVDGAIDLAEGSGWSQKDDAASYEPLKIEIVHNLSATEKAEAVAAASRHLGTRRMVNVFPSSLQVGGETVTGEFGACAVAGLISATEPQQPLTNMNVSGIDGVPAIYSIYSEQELNVMAAGGTFIIAQDLPGDAVYVRHQVTTAYSDGNLNTGEVSITKNVDSVAYAFAELYRPYYGKYNITPGLLSILGNIGSQLISQLCKDTGTYGPQLIEDGSEIKYVRQNELVKDHVDVGVSLNVPYPCNNIDVVLTV